MVDAVFSTRREETERALQDIVVQSVSSSQLYTIPNTFFGAAAQINLTIPLNASRHRIVMVQDSKQALKTARNQVLTGSRVLAMGDDPTTARSWCPSGRSTFQARC